MKKIIYALTFLLISNSAVKAQDYKPSPEIIQSQKEFQDMKFGLFIHWGVFSILSDGEWVMNNRNIKVNDYKKLQQFYNPTQYNPAEWVSMAKKAGMKYITFITRHHDGFSNWDTKQSDWKITNTPYGKDVLKELADECHKQGIKLFLYYSLLDWSRDDYQYETGRTGKGAGRTKKGEWLSYINFMKAQLTELLTNYGEISGIWFDGHWDQLGKDKDKKVVSKVDWHYNEIYSLIHKLQPQCMIGNNHHLSLIAGEDFQMFEKDLPGENTTSFADNQSISHLPLESCETMNLSWGYSLSDNKYKSVQEIVQYLVKDAGLNANLLLNVGPMSNGKIQTEFVDTLAKVGEWMQTYGQTIYNTRGANLNKQDWGTATINGKTMYLHILNKKDNSPYILIKGFNQKIKSSLLFTDKKPLKVKQQKEGTYIYLDKVLLNNIDTIIQLDLK